MELVARDLKALGLYTSRALSFAGVEYDILRHELTRERQRVSIMPRTSLPTSRDSSEIAN